MGKVHFDALSKDATTWSTVATEIDGIRGAVESIEIYRGAFSFAAMDVFDSYAQVRQQVIELLSAGANAASTALTDIRIAVEANEDAAVSEFGGMWTPRDL